jgi:signal transduction histidine kinase
LAFLWTGGFFYIDLGTLDILAFLSTYVAAIIIGSLFAYNNYLIEQEKLQAMKMLSGTIAHELRTPLAAITSIGNALARILPFYQEGYERAKATSLLERAVEKKDEAYLADIPQSLRTLSQNANITINMLLANLSENLGERKLEPCSIVTCVKEAIETYPFSPIQRPLVHWQGSGKWQNNIPQDFSFLGHKELLKHVLFNLFKNALYAIAVAGKGEIFITIEPAEKKGDKKFSRLIFKDTGPGMPPQVLRHIFDRFYTKTEHGTGIGLAFCQNVMHGFGGEIACTSQHGEYTTFTLSFPVIKEKA